MPNESPVDFDVGIIGAGPAGLSAAVTLGRARRRVVLFDHGKPRNRAAQGIHCYLGLEGLTPAAIRDRGREEARAYGVELRDAEVVRVVCLNERESVRTAFEVHTADQAFTVRAILFATGVMDILPDIAGLNGFYGRSVHHCPYCDGWEHRDQHLVALGKANVAVKLAATLRGWSDRVTACTNGDVFEEEDCEFMARNGIRHRAHAIGRLAGQNGVLERIVFEDGSELPCDALFFSSEQAQRSSLPSMVGCALDDEGLIVTGEKHCTSVKGVFVAGDADGDVQFAIVAAAEGATAATAINAALQKEDLK